MLLFNFVLFLKHTRTDPSEPSLLQKKQLLPVLTLKLIRLLAESNQPFTRPGILPFSGRSRPLRIEPRPRCYFSYPDGRLRRTFVS